MPLALYKRALCRGLNALYRIHYGVLKSVRMVRPVCGEHLLATLCCANCSIKRCYKGGGHWPVTCGAATCRPVQPGSGRVAVCRPAYGQNPRSPHQRQTRYCAAYVGGGQGPGQGIVFSSLRRFNHARVGHPSARAGPSMQRRVAAEQAQTLAQLKALRRVFAQK